MVLIFKIDTYLFHSECLFVKKDIMDYTALAVNDLTIKYGDICHVVDIIVANKQQLVNISSLKLWALVNIQLSSD